MQDPDLYDVDAMLKSMSKPEQADQFGVPSYTHRKPLPPVLSPDADARDYDPEEGMATWVGVLAMLACAVVLILAAAGVLAIVEGVAR